MENKKLIQEYLKFKKDCVDEGMFILNEILRLFKIKKELNQDA